MEFLKSLSEPLKKSPFYCRPLCYFITVFLIALATLMLNKMIFAVMCVIMVIYCLFASRRVGLFSAFNILTVVFLLAAVPFGLYSERDRNIASSCDGQNIEADILINEVIYQEAYSSRYNATLIRIGGQKINCEVTVEFPFETDYEPFDTVSVKADAIDLLKGASFSERLMYISKNRALDLSVTDAGEMSSNARNGFRYEIYRVRCAIRENFAQVLPASAAGYAEALLLGETDGLSISFQNDMTALGVAHILAVSGMHTSVLAGILMAICERLRMRRRLKSVMIAAVSVIFMFIAGMSPSITRAVVMLIMSLLPMFFGRRSDSIASLFYAVFIICIISPEKVLSCSLLLSFMSCLAIVVCIPAFNREAKEELGAARDGSMKRFYKILRKLMTAAAISLSCSLITVPLIALYFGETSFVSVPANLVMVPISTVSMVLSVPLAVFAKVPFIGKALAAVFEFLYAVTKSIADVATSLGDTTVSLRYPFFVPILLFVLAMFLYIRLSGIRKPIALMVPFMLGAVIFATSLQIYGVAVSDRTEAVYMTSATSEGFLVVSGQDTMYIDMGNGGRSLPETGIEISEEHYCTVSMSGFMLTHYHSGHISVMRSVLLFNKVEKLYLPEPESEYDEGILRDIAALATDSEIIMFRRGEPVEFGNTVIKTSNYTLLERSSHPVLRLEIDLGEKELLWLGLSVTESNQAIEAEKALSSADAVICGHHGPKMKEYIKFYSDHPSDIPIIISEFSDEWKYGLSPNLLLESDDDGFAMRVLK